MAPNKIPDRWEPYIPCGEQIEGTRFITFKVPLKESLSQKLKDESYRFTPIDLITTIEDKAAKLGLVIDLTNTNRYYNREEILNNEIEYKKIFTEGKKVPSKAVQESFMNTVDDFLERNTDNEKLVGVHCTHGLNRTGYLVCRYMIDKLNIDPDTAIKSFNDARGHEIERPHYLADLRGEPYVDPFENEQNGRYNRQPNGHYRQESDTNWRQPPRDRVDRDYRDDRGVVRWNQEHHRREDRRHPYNRHESNGYWDSRKERDHHDGYMEQAWGNQYDGYYNTDSRRDRFYSSNYSRSRSRYRGCHQGRNNYRSGQQNGYRSNFN